MMTGADSSYLTRKHFLAAIAAALAGHALAFGAWVAAPSSPAVDIPVRMLNIKLGDGDEKLTPETVAQPVPPRNTHQVEATLTRSLDNRQPEKTFAPRTPDVPSPRPEVEKPEPPPQPSETAQPVNPLEQAARQFVRERELTPEEAAALNASAPGSVMGNSQSSDAEMLKRYEQMISGWIQRFKVYPEEARRQQVIGKGKVRIRIDRMGNIVYRVIHERSGSELLDRAALDMVDRANPVPPVPPTYPNKSDRIEFLIGFSYGW